MTHQPFLPNTPFRIVLAGTPATQILYLSGKVTESALTCLEQQFAEAEKLVLAPSEGGAVKHRVVFDLHGIEEFDAAGAKRIGEILIRWSKANRLLFLVAQPDIRQGSDCERLAEELMSMGLPLQYQPAASLKTVLRSATFRGAAFRKLAS